MRLLVCGSRDWQRTDLIREALRPYAGAILIHGNAPGADTLARLIGATEFRMFEEPYPADWRTHGKAAGPIRNQQMLTEGRPDQAIAFRLGPVSKGTDDMIRRLRNAGVPVTVIEDTR